MGFWILVLAGVVVALWTSISKLRERLNELEREHTSSRAIDATVRELKERVQRLEQTHGGSTAASEREPETEPAPAPPEEPGEQDEEPEPAPVAAPAPVPTSPSVPPAVPPPANEAPSEPAAPPGPPRSLEPTPRAAPHSTAPSPATSTAAWEVMVGSDWLNKLGVLIFVIGMALLVSYSVTQVGPMGRVAMGYVVSLAMLGAGVVVERRPRYKVYGYGLVAGGWAGIYFTTYAMHGIAAARVIESEVTGAVLLTLVAGVMVAHAIRYRSQTVTVLAFVVAYATLAIAPLTWFALFAALPLAATVLVVAHRFGWTPVAGLGIAATYVLFALRDFGVRGDPLDAQSIAPYLMLATYWLVFESADLMALARHRSEESGTRSLVALNAVGVTWCTALAAPAGGVPFLWAFLAALGLGYTASAITRRRLLLAGGSPAADPPRTITSFHLAVAMAGGLVMWSSGSRFEEDRLAMTWLIEAQLLIAIGFILVDPIVRKIGGLAFVVAVGYGLLTAIDATVLISMMAVAGYTNREWLRSRGAAAAVPELGYAFAATGLAVIVLVQEVDWQYLGLALLAAGVLLLEVGLRRAVEYRVQAYALGFIGGWLILLLFTNLNFTTTREVWLVLPAAMAVCWVGALRVATGSDDSRTDERDAAAVTMAWLGTALLTVLLWRVVPDVWLGPAWAATGAALLGLGVVWPLGLARWQGYTLMFVGAFPALAGVLGAVPAGSQAITALLITVAILYGASVTAVRIPRGATEETERWALRILTTAAAALLTVLQWREVPVAWSGTVIAATGAMHVGFGLAGQAAFPRWQGYGLALLGSLRAFTPILANDPASSVQIAAALIVIALLYGVVLVALVALRSAADETERAGLGTLFVAATAMLATVEWRVLPLAWSGPAIAFTGLVLFAAGASIRVSFLRAQGYALLLLAVLRAGGPLWAPRGAPLPEIAGLLAVIAILYLASYLGRQAIREDAWDAEWLAPRLCLLGATVLLTVLVLAQMPESLVTLSWGLMGLLLLVAGFPMRERLVRLSGLALLALCILKLFVYDLRELEALARIFSFVVLGLVLLAVSWAYTRFGDQIRRFL